MKTDEMFRQRVRAYDPGGHGGLTEAERQKILAHVLSHGPGLIRRASWGRAALAATGLAVATAAGALLSLSPENSATLAVVKDPTQVPARACERDKPTSPPAFTWGADGHGELALGVRAEFVTSAGADVRIDKAEPCTTRISLRSGQIRVFAKDLGGGELRVATRLGDVVVRGTMFSVEQHDDSVSVQVEHGRVSVHHDGRELASVAGGQRADIDGTDARLSRLSEADGAALRDTFVAGEARPAVVDPLTGTAARTTQARRPSEVKPRAPVASASAVLGAAETRWREGQFVAARAMFRRVGVLAGPTGEAAWVRLARLELNQGHATRALDALRERERRCAGGVLAAEAAWLEVAALDRARRLGPARARAGALIARFPGSPQAGAASRFLKRTEAP